MAPPNPSRLVAASKPATRAASAFTPELQHFGPDLQEAFSANLRSDRCVGREVSGELGYGCVDWYLYVTDTAVSVATLHTSDE
jgi:hypothetical protein